MWYCHGCKGQVWESRIDHRASSPACWEANQTEWGRLFKEDAENAQYGGWIWGIYSVRCVVCGEQLYIPSSQQRYCSVGCMRKAMYARQKSRRHAGRQEAICPRCDGAFIQRRTDQKYCSGACRQAAHRKRVTAYE